MFCNIIAILSRSFAEISVLYGPGCLVKRDTTYRVITNHLGSIKLIVNASTGEIVQNIEYDEFGNISSLLNENSLPAAVKRRREFTDFGFAGGLYDADTKLVRFGARDYNPEIGRWTAKDPIGFGGGQSNFYEYCLNDPINAVDINGLQVVQMEGPHNDLQIQLLFYNMWIQSGKGFSPVEVYASIYSDGGHTGMQTLPINNNAEAGTGSVTVIIPENAAYLAHTHATNYFGHGYSAEGGPLDYNSKLKGNYAVSDQGIWLVTDPENYKGDQVLGSNWISELIKKYEEWLKQKECQ